MKILMFRVIYSKLSFLSFVFLLFVSCKLDELLEDSIFINHSQYSDSYSFSAEEDSLGRINAVKKARLMTDIVFTPLKPIDYNSGTFDEGRSYKGLIYSSVKELETYVGSNVSFHTFLSAISNPRSRIYTEKINESPYHGINCRAYYGTVCSDLVCYALGINSPRLNSFDFPDSELMEPLNDMSIEKLKVADVLWRNGHVALISDILKDDEGFTEGIEISEAIDSRCKRYIVSKESYSNTVLAHFSAIYRYKRIGYNTQYEPVSEYKTIDDLASSSYFGNNLCVDKGDKSNYLESETVTINILNSKCDALEVYKDDELYLKKSFIEPYDVSLLNLPYGDYKARLLINEEIGDYSEFTYWKVVNAIVKYDKKLSRLFFSSHNSKPEHIVCCDISGSRPPLKDSFYLFFTDENIKNGYVYIPKEKKLIDYPFLVVFFTTDYGRIICKTPI